MLVRPDNPEKFDPLTSDIFVPKLVLRLPGITQRGVGRLPGLPCRCCPCRACSDGYPDELTITFAITGDAEAGSCCSAADGSYIISAFIGQFPNKSEHSCSWRWRRIRTGVCNTGCGFATIELFLNCQEEFEDSMGFHPAALGINGILGFNHNVFPFGKGLFFSRGLDPDNPPDCKAFNNLNMTNINYNDWVCDATHKCTNPVATISISS